MPINYVHSTKALSAVMIAKIKGFYDVASKLIELGAIIANGADPTQTTTDISYQQQMQHEVDDATAMEAEYELAMQQFLSTAYQLTSATDEIDHHLLVATIKFLHLNQPCDGSILVFLPGYDDIMASKELIESHLPEMNYQLFVLHSGMQGTNQSDQKRVFQRLPKGMRKIILSTNIAETSLTIDDVVYVVDAGKVKQTTYDSLSETTCLTSTYISQACAKQRAGRAGRTRPGTCFRLYSIEHYDVMEPFTLPELLRVPLTDICLNAKILGPSISIEQFLLKALQPPPVMSIRQSISLLKRIDALDPKENVTELGVHLADFPVDAQLAKCILYSVTFRCVNPVVIIISALSVKDPFVLPFHSERGEIESLKKRLANDTFSDHMVLLNVYMEWQCQKQFNKERIYCQRNNISNSTMEMISGVRSLIMRHLNEVGLISDSNCNFNEYAEQWSVIKACLTAGLYPNVCHIDGSKLVSKQDRKLLPHRSSILRKHNNSIDPDMKNTGLDWLIHGEKSKPSYVAVIRNVSPVSSLAIALFTGHIDLPHDCIELIGSLAADSDDDSDYDDYDDRCMGTDSEDCQPVYFSLDDFVVFRTTEQYARSIYSIRFKFNIILMKMLKNMQYYEPSTADTNVIATLAYALQNEEYDECTLTAPQPILTPSRNALNNREYLNNSSPKRVNNKFKQNQRSGNRNVQNSFQQRNRRMSSNMSFSSSSSSTATSIAAQHPPHSANITRSALQTAINNAEERAKGLTKYNPSGSVAVDYTLPSAAVVFDAVVKLNAGLVPMSNDSNTGDRRNTHIAVATAITPSTSNEPMPAFRPKQCFTMITREMAAESNSFKYFLLTIPSIGKLFTTIFASNRWNFQTPLSQLQKHKEVSCLARCIFCSCDDTTSLIEK